MAQEDTNVIDQPEVIRHKMVTVELAGKKYEVPEGITIIKALWYSGQEVIRGAGCLGGFCGACAAKLRSLALQGAAELEDRGVGVGGPQPVAPSGAEVWEALGLRPK